MSTSTKQTLVVRQLKKGKHCPDYHDILQCSVECQNCRYNIFIDGEPGKQSCRDHSQHEARLKGAPTAVPEEVIRQRMDAVAKKHAEEMLAKQMQEATIREMSNCNIEDTL